MIPVALWDRRDDGSKCVLTVLTTVDETYGAVAYHRRRGLLPSVLRKLSSSQERRPRVPGTLGAEFRPR